MINSQLTMSNEAPHAMDAEADYHVQDTAGGAWTIGAIGATLVGVVVVGVALVIVGLKRMRPW